MNPYNIHDTTAGGHRIVGPYARGHIVAKTDKGIVFENAFMVRKERISKRDRLFLTPKKLRIANQHRSHLARLQGEMEDSIHELKKLQPNAC